MTCLAVCKLSESLRLRKLVRRLIQSMKMTLTSAGLFVVIGQKVMKLVALLGLRWKTVNLSALQLFKSVPPRRQCGKRGGRVGVSEQVRVSR